jgi:hypothetical protein
MVILLWALSAGKTLYISIVLGLVKRVIPIKKYVIDSKIKTIFEEKVQVTLHSLKIEGMERYEDILQLKIHPLYFINFINY